MEGEIITRKIRGVITTIGPFTPKTADFHIHKKATKQPNLKPNGRKQHSASSVKIGATGLNTANKLPMLWFGWRS